MMVGYRDKSRKKKVFNEAKLSVVSLRPQLLCTIEVSHVGGKMYGSFVEGVNHRLLTRVVNLIHKADR